MSQNEIVRFALNNRWLEEQGVPDMNAPAAIAALEKMRSLTAWTEARSQSRLDRSSPWGKGPSLIGTALYGAVRRVVWDPGANYSRGPDCASCFVGELRSGASNAPQAVSHHNDWVEFP